MQRQITIVFLSLNIAQIRLKNCVLHRLIRLGLELKNSFENTRKMISVCRLEVFLYNFFETIIFYLFASRNVLIEFTLLFEMKFFKINTINRFN